MASGRGIRRISTQTCAVIKKRSCVKTNPSASTSCYFSIWVGVMDKIHILWYGKFWLLHKIYNDAKMIYKSNFTKNLSWSTVYTLTFLNNFTFDSKFFPFCPRNYDLLSNLFAFFFFLSPWKRIAANMSTKYCSVSSYNMKSFLVFFISWQYILMLLYIVITRLQIIVWWENEKWDEKIDEKILNWKSWFCLIIVFCDITKRLK